jgi:hypothetical protein
MYCGQLSRYLSSAAEVRAEKERREPAQLKKENFDAPVILEFLNYLETHRGNQARTRNLSAYGKEFDRLKSLGWTTCCGIFVWKAANHRAEQYLSPDLVAAMSHFNMGLVFSTVTIPRG